MPPSRTSSVGADGTEISWRNALADLSRASRIT
jgi:hypothetical protein